MKKLTFYLNFCFELFLKINSSFIVKFSNFLSFIPVLLEVRPSIALNKNVLYGRFPFIFNLQKYILFHFSIIQIRI
jgi:hypothetical protein